MIRSWASYSVGMACCALLLQASARAAAPDASPEWTMARCKRWSSPHRSANRAFRIVGVAVTALSRDDLRSYGIVDSKDIVRMVPNVLLDSTASGGVNANLTVRGISQSDFSSNQESPNSMYIDEVYLSSPSAAAFTLYDLDRVEVLRGPQGNAVRPEFNWRSGQLHNGQAHQPPGRLRRAGCRSVQSGLRRSCRGWGNYRQSPGAHLCT